MKDRNPTSQILPQILPRELLRLRDLDPLLAWYLESATDAALFMMFVSGNNLRIGGRCFDCNDVIIQSEGY
jgi:hypothetical protein